ncbi:CCC motif membrane protein [Winogradskyella schleiferi]|uniref:CCC motif membrane protein n=1 Tax=Winogradskyella schleiferi TaxID=2686078 RepID=UPI0015BD26D3|nr:CCC motif membrane protein [Winogradskyella schleiferi]
MNKLSADPLALILGILALVIGISSCCCYGITAILPLAMAIIGLVTANKSLREFRENPEAYDPQSRSNVNTAKIINIFAIVINGLIVLMVIGVLIFYGTMLSSGFLDEFKDFDNDVIIKVMIIIIQIPSLIQLTLGKKMIIVLNRKWIPLI